MPLVLADRVKETTTTTGTGTLTLAGASTGFQSFSVVGNGNTTYYAISSSGGSEWEVGIGTYTSSGTTLARTTILASSNSGSAVNLSAGTKDVFVTYPSGISINKNKSLALSIVYGY
jgi:filamentous hemagglutinin family protein